jgi:hypothetical protein
MLQMRGEGLMSCMPGGHYLLMHAAVKTLLYAYTHHTAGPSGSYHLFLRTSFLSTMKPGPAWIVLLRVQLLVLYNAASPSLS